MNECILMTSLSQLSLTMCTESSMSIPSLPRSADIKLRVSSSSVVLLHDEALVWYAFFQKEPLVWYVLLQREPPVWYAFLPPQTATRSVCPTRRGQSTTHHGLLFPLQIAPLIMPYQVNCLRKRKSTVHMQTVAHMPEGIIMWASGSSRSSSSRSSSSFVARFIRWDCLTRSWSLSLKENWLTFSVSCVQYTTGTRRNLASLISRCFRICA